MSSQNTMRVKSARVITVGLMISLIAVSVWWAIGQAGDVALGISTSGSSQNVIKALEVAKKMGMVTIGLTGKDGGEIAKIVDYSLNVSSNSTPRIQEVHITVGHVICEMIDFKLFQRPDVK